MHVDRESLAEKSLSQAFPASNVGVRLENNIEVKMDVNIKQLQGTWDWV